MTHALLWSVACFGGFVLLVILVDRFAIASPPYTGTVSDHFDGKRFFFPNSPAMRNVGDLIRWQLNAEPGQWTTTPWYERNDTPVGTPPAQRVEGDSLVITFINHATVLIQTHGVNILTDPIWSERASPLSFIGPRRARPAGVHMRDLPPIDIVLLSHNHYDHLDIPTLQQLCVRQPNVPKIIVPLGVKALLERHGIPVTAELDWWQQTALTALTGRSYDEQLSVHCVPAQHFSGRGLSDMNTTLWCGYVLSSPSGNVYFAGDTGYNTHFRAIRQHFGSFRAALLPIGAYRPEWFMAPVHISPKEAVQAFMDLGSPPSIGIHFGTFNLADDGELEPQEELTRQLHAAHAVPGRFVVPREGAAMSF